MKYTRAASFQQHSHSQLTTSLNKKKHTHTIVEIFVFGICLNLMKSNAQAFMLMEICELNKFIQCYEVHGNSTPPQKKIRIFFLFIPK